MPVSKVGDFYDKSHATSRRHGLYTGPSSYTTGGESITPESLALGRIDNFHVEALSNGTDLRLARYDYTNEKVKVFDLAGAEIANGTDLSTYSGRFEAIGK